MAKYKIKFSKDARNDYFNIIRYIKYKLFEPDIANNYAKMVKEEINKLEYTTQSFAIIPNDTIKYNNIRKLIIKNYIVFYRVNESDKMVNIERILYGASNWEEII